MTAPDWLQTMIEWTEEKCPLHASRGIWNALLGWHPVAPRTEVRSSPLTVTPSGGGPRPGVIRRGGDADGGRASAKGSELEIRYARATRSSACGVTQMGG